MLGTALERQRATIRELRDLSFALEPVVLRDQGFEPALHALAEQLGTTNKIRIDLDVEAATQIGETAQVALYTIIRELLDQAVRRGPPTPHRGEHRVQPTDGGAATTIADDAEPERRRRSFEAIEERVKQLHGDDRGRARRTRARGSWSRCRRTRRRTVSSAPMGDGNGYLLFVWSPAGYSLREVEGDLPQLGSELEEGDRLLVVSKIGASPLPGDSRRCAFSVGK